MSFSVILNQRPDPITTKFSELSKFDELPDQINLLLSESGRYQHIQSIFLQNVETTVEFPAIDEPSSLEHPQQFNKWLLETDRGYKTMV